LGFEIGSLPAGIRYPLGSLAAFSYGHLTGLNKFDGLNFTKPDALGITVTNIAFENPPIGGVKIHGPKGTDTDA
jgi:hypothetical protein